MFILLPCFLCLDYVAPPKEGAVKVKQMTVDDWFEVFISNTKAADQVRIIEERKEAGLTLATWEINALRAYQRLNDRQ
jgi:hypothetical protein